MEQGEGGREQVGDDDDADAGMGPGEGDDETEKLLENELLE